MNLQRGDTIKCKDVIEAQNYSRELEKLGYSILGEADYMRDTFTITIVAAPEVENETDKCGQSS